LIKYGHTNLNGTISCTLLYLTTISVMPYSTVIAKLIISIRPKAKWKKSEGKIIKSPVVISV